MTAAAPGSPARPEDAAQRLADTIGPGPFLPNSIYGLTLDVLAELAAARAERDELIGKLNRAWHTADGVREQNARLEKLAEAVMQDEDSKSCDSCKHWKPPSEREDFASAVKMPPVVGEWSEAAYDALEILVNEADKQFGECNGVPDNPRLGEIPTPGALVVDGSDYRAQLYTAADFYCALWSPTEPNGSTG